jgi:hypothetical protein
MPVPPEWAEKLSAFVEAWGPAMKNGSGGYEYIGDTPFPKFILTEQADSWDDFLAWLADLRGTWCFRG